MPAVRETISVETVCSNTNIFHFHAINAILNQEGRIFDFSGTMLAAYWQDEKPENAVEAACLAALSLADQLQADTNFGSEKFLFNVSVHYGVFLEGNFGSERRIHRSLLGGSVNHAARLCQTNNQYGTRIIISDAALEFVRQNFSSRQLDQIYVVGQDEPFKIYELINKTT